MTLNVRTYAVPPVYVFIHLFLGAVAVTHVCIVPLFAGYQLLQYFLGCRFFAFEAKILPGNSWCHTLKKSAHFALGYTVAWLGIVVARRS
jgi:hypothetical protein